MKKILLIIILIVSFQNNLLAQNFSKFNQWLLENGHFRSSDVPRSWLIAEQ